MLDKEAKISYSGGMLAIQEKLHSGIKNEVGNQYGRWAVICFAKIDSRNQAHWLCRCACGTERPVSGANLRKGGSQSCGCILKEKRYLPREVAAFNKLLSSLKTAAKKRNYKFLLTKIQVRELVTQNCHYCGSPPSQIIRAESALGGIFTYNGLDRVNNTKGYIAGNVVPCCGLCNWMKRDLSIEEFKAHISYIYNHWVD